MLKKIFIILSSIFLVTIPAYAGGITISSGATVTLSGSPVLTTVNLVNSGTLIAGAGTINLSGNWKMG